MHGIECAAFSHFAFPCIDTQDEFFCHQLPTIDVGYLPSDSLM